MIDPAAASAAWREIRRQQWNTALHELNERCAVLVESRAVGTHQLTLTGGHEGTVIVEARWPRHVIIGPYPLPE